VTRPRVLVADDHVGVRKALAAVLDLIGFEVVGQATDGAEAVALAKELAPDLVVMDLSMPTLNGLDATRLLREALPATPVVVFTAFEGDKLKDAARTAGAPPSSKAPPSSTYARSCTAPSSPYGPTPVPNPTRPHHNQAAAHDPAETNQRLPSKVESALGQLSACSGHSRTTPNCGHDLVLLAPERGR
jgi:DNA-binding NarL/FixJ family response regulator